MRNNRLKWSMRVGAGLLVSFWTVARAEIEALSSSVILDRFRDIPVEMATGELKLSPPPDLFVKSRGLNFDVTRNYRSQRTEPGPFGYCWNWSHGERLIIRGFDLIDIVTPTVTVTTYKSLICTSIVQYAHTVIASAKNSWENPSGAVGEPDAWSGWGHYAYNFNGAPLDAMVGYGWGFTNIPGVCITGVYVLCSGAVEREFSKPHGLQLNLSAETYNTNLYWSHKAYSWAVLEITPAKAEGWTWSDVNNLRVRTDLPLWSQGHTDSIDAFIDCLGVQVTYVAVSETNKEFVLPKGAPFRLEDIGSPATSYKLIYRDGRTSFFLG